MLTKLKKEHKIFADEYIRTGDKAKSYLKAFPTTKPNAAAANAQRLIKNDKVQNYIYGIQSEIKEKTVSGLVLTIEEKRSILKNIATGKAEINTTTVTKRGEVVPVTRKPTFNDIVRAIELDSRISGEIQLPKVAGEIDESLFKIHGDKIIVIQNFIGLI